MYNMKKVVVIIMLILLAYCVGIGQNLEQSFSAPPHSAKPWIYWFWMSGHVTREGIKKDIEMILKAGIGGVLIMEAKHHILPDGPIKYSSDEWYALKKYVAEEAGRLGIEVTSHVCEGWSATGGPWVTPDKAMKILAFTETFVESSGKNILGYWHFLQEKSPSKSKTGTSKDCIINLSTYEYTVSHMTHDRHHRMTKFNLIKLLI